MNKKIVNLVLAVTAFIYVPFGFLVLGKLAGVYTRFFSHVWPTQEWPNGDKLYPTIAMVCLVTTVLVMLGFLIEVFSDEKDKDETKHSCDICGDKVKKGEGHHYKKEDSCYCVCGTCLPTHSIQ